LRSGSSILSFHTPVNWGAANRRQVILLTFCKRFVMIEWNFHFWYCMFIRLWHDWLASIWCRGFEAHQEVSHPARNGDDRHILLAWPWFLCELHRPTFFRNILG
jgi:hypothetical protein